MNSKLNGIIALSFIAGVCVAEDPKTPPPSPKPQINLQRPNMEPPPKPSKEDLSAAIGFKFGNSIKNAKFDVDPDLIVKSMKETLAGNSKMEDRKASEIINGAVIAAQKATKERGEKFLAENAKKPGVKVLPSGLQYKVIKEGTGATPKANDIITAHYTGRLIDGTKFDSSYDHPGAQPLQRPANRLIPGWTEALQLMKVGSKWELYIPSQLAYGERGSPPKIGPDEALVFEMELLDVKAPEPAPAPPATATGKTNESVVSGEIIKVPSAEEMKKGAKIEVIKQSDLTNAVKTTNAPNKK